MINHIEQNPNDSLAAMYNLRNDMAEGFIQTGQLLSHIKRCKLYRFKGYETFKDYLEIEHNMKSALANKLIRIHQIYVEELDTDEYTIKAIGLDRLDMMAPLLDKADWQQREELLIIAQNTPISELSDILKEMKKQEQTPDLKKILVDQFKEKMCNLFNTSWSEVIFKLALYFTNPNETDTFTLSSMKQDIRKLQNKFEQELSSHGPDIFEQSNAYSSDGILPANDSSPTTSPTKEQRDANG